MANSRCSPSPRLDGRTGSADDRRAFLGIGASTGAATLPHPEETEAAGHDYCLVEQNIHLALALSDYAYVLAEGRVQIEGPAREVANMDEIAEHTWESECRWKVVNYTPGTTCAPPQLP